MIMEKMRAYLWKLQTVFWTYGLIRLLDPGGPNAVSGSQTPRSRNFLRFHDFIGFISWFLRKWWPVCENCSYGSGHMAWYVFWTQVAQIQFPGPRPQGHKIFWDFMILLDLSHNSWVLVLDPRRQSFGIWFFFHVKFHKILHQISPYFQILGHFWQSNECLFPEISKKPFFLVPFQVCKFPLKSCLKKPAFLSTKIEISPEPLGQI